MRIRCASFLTSLAALSAACGAGAARPSSVEDVARAFESQDVALVEQPEDVDDAWGTRLVARDAGVRLEVVVFVDPEGARNVASTLVSLAQAGIALPRLGGSKPGSPRTERVERRGNVVVLVPAGSSASSRLRIARALDLLPER